MSQRRKFSWVFRYYNVMTGEVEYKVRHDLTVDSANFCASEFVKENSDYCVCLFKLYKKINYGK